MALSKEKKFDSDKVVATPSENFDKSKETYYIASQWELIRVRFFRHRLAVVSTILIIIIYLMCFLAEFFAPYPPNRRFDTLPLIPPQRVRFVDEEGKFHWRPFVYGYSRKINLKTFKRTYTPDPSKNYPIYLFVRGSDYKLWGLFRTNLHLYGSKDPEGIVALLGTDDQGRDLLSRIIYGGRISLSVGLVGVALSLVLGTVIGGVSGYFGGEIDNVIQRLVEIISSIPSLPLWMALSAAIPDNWPVLRVYFMITIILSLISWGGLARVVRGKFLSLREEDYVLAAKLAGSSTKRIIFRHMLPAFTSHMIATATLSIPGMILGETALSFLGIGLRPPAISWGVLLQKAQNVHAVAVTPWLLLPALFVVLSVLTFNFVGDGMRDAADPYR